MRLEVHGVSSMVVCHFVLWCLGQGVRGASVTWHVLRGWEVPTIGLPASLVTLLYLNNTPHILFWWGGGGWRRRQQVWVVSPLSIVTSRLEPRKWKKQISKFIKTRNKQKKTYIGTKWHNGHLGLRCIHLLLQQGGVDLGMVVAGVGRVVVVGREGGWWRHCQQWWLMLMLMFNIHHVMCWGWAEMTLQVNNYSTDEKSPFLGWKKIS